MSFGTWRFESSHPHEPNAPSATGRSPFRSPDAVGILPRVSDQDGCCSPSRGGTGSTAGDLPAVGPGAGSTAGMVQLGAATTRMGSDDPWAYAADGEGPPREVSLSPFWIDACAVSNDDFGAFVTATGHVTEAERFGWSFVFVGLLPPGFPPTQAVAQAP